MNAGMTRPLIYFVRHGQTHWNAEGRLQGQAENDINDNGRRQADRNGAAPERADRRSPRFRFRRKSDATHPRDDGARARRDGP